MALQPRNFVGEGSQRFLQINSVAAGEVQAAFEHSSFGIFLLGFACRALRTAFNIPVNFLNYFRIATAVSNATRWLGILARRKRREGSPAKTKVGF